MPDPHRSDEAYARAHKRMEDLRGFYMHLLMYLSVGLGLFIVDVLTPGGPWFYWILIGWGMLVLLHGVSILLVGSLFGPQWEERRIRHLMERDRSRRPPQPPQPLAP